MDLICTSWSSLATYGFKPDTLVIGNGASINIHRSFAYEALKDSAGDEVRKIMEQANEHDFEALLSRLSTALNVLDMYDFEFDDAIEKITQTQNKVKNGLIAAVTSVHPAAYPPLAKKLKPLATFAAQFNTVLSLNYDLLLYWATYSVGSDKPAHFMDCWNSGSFSFDAPKYRRTKGSKPVLVFYPHGNLFINATVTGAEQKVASGYGKSLLEVIRESLKERSFPLFVSEGESEKKLSQIRSSDYLSYVLQKQIKEKSIGSTCFYGCSFNDRDNHIWLPLLEKSDFTVAVVYDDNDQERFRRACWSAKVSGSVYVTSPADTLMWAG